MAESNKSVVNGSKILRKLIKVFGILILLIIFFLVWFDQSRSFYCLSSGECVTVWKRLGNNCFVIPNKYYGIFKPSSSFIETSNSQYLTLYFTDKLPKKIIVRNQGSSNSQKGKYTINNEEKSSWRIVEYSDEYKSQIYNPDALKFNDIKTGVKYIDLNIKQDYATNKTGEKIE